MTSTEALMERLAELEEKQRAVAAELKVCELKKALRDMMACVDYLMRHSLGVSGLQSNGELVTWDWLLEHGYFKAEFEYAEKVLGD